LVAMLTICVYVAETNPTAGWAGAERLELPTGGFGIRCSSN
jgi:hypothetical protein